LIFNHSPKGKKMADILIYTKSTCPYCAKAKSLLSKKGQKFTEIDITGNDDLRAQMIEKANGRHTVPQIFINNEHIGGCDDLHALDDAGELDKKL
jgi:glutaredoxin 3